MGPIPNKIIFCSFIPHGQVESNKSIRRMPYSFCSNTVYLLRPIDAYMCQWTAPSFDKFMVCRLFATGHYPKQCWLIVSWTSKVTYSNEILFENKYFFKKMHAKMSLAKFRPFCLGRNVLACYETDHKSWSVIGRVSNVNGSIMFSIIAHVLYATTHNVSNCRDITWNTIGRYSWKW